jgi:hypothetical protein
MNIARNDKNNLGREIDGQAADAMRAPLIVDPRAPEHRSSHQGG